jgi:hypothetical protein
MCVQGFSSFQQIAAMRRRPNRPCGTVDAKLQFGISLAEENHAQTHPD